MLDAFGTEVSVGDHVIFTMESNRSVSTKAVDHFAGVVTEIRKKIKVRITQTQNETYGRNVYDEVWVYNYRLVKVV